MCGRVTLTTSQLPEIAELLDADLDPAEAAAWHPRYNVAPTDRHFIARSDGDRRRLVPAFWGFVVDKRPLLINARAETVAERPAFSRAFADRRCIIPTDGFYEWAPTEGWGGSRRPREGESRRPFWLHAPDGAPILMAGLYEVSPEGHTTFTILTTVANEVVAPIHDRMPVILPRARLADWLARPALDLLVPAAPDVLVPREVCPRVNHVRNDDPECLAPPPPPPLPKQLRLF